MKLHLVACLAMSVLLAGCGKDDAKLDEAPKAFRVGFQALETSSERLESLDDYDAYLTKELGVPVEIHRVTDYTGVAQAMASGQIDLTITGASNYANLRAQMGDGVRPILTAKEDDGSLGYYAVIIVRADSSYRSIDDLRGKNFAFADINSASGYLVPRYMLRKEGKDTDKFFAKTIFAGGHQQAIVAVVKKQVDAAVTWSSMVGDTTAGYSRGVLHQMVAAGLLDMKDLRIIWKGGPIPNGPMVIRTALPAAFIEKVIEAHLKAPREIFEAIEQGQGMGFERVDHDFYKTMIEMRQAEEAARRGG